MTILQAETRLTAMRQTRDAVFARAAAAWRHDKDRGQELEEQADRLDTAIMRGPEREIATAVPRSLEELAAQLRLLVSYGGDDAQLDDEGNVRLVLTVGKNALACVEGLIADGSAGP
jgi:hypothetical protein